MGIPANKRASSFAPGGPPPPTLNAENEPHCRIPSVPTSTTPYLPGYRISKVFGTVHGITTCARKDTKSFLKAAQTGTEAKSLTHMMYNARDQATERMVKDCVSRGGNAIIGIGFGESKVMGFAQVSVYGTAVYVEKEQYIEDPFMPK
jgi:uncharacterized protein YbjQ (UPF0145 family)